MYVTKSRYVQKGRREEKTAPTNHHHRIVIANIIITIKAHITHGCYKNKIL